MTCDPGTWEGQRGLFQKAMVRYREETFTPPCRWARNHLTMDATNSQFGDQGSLVILYLTQVRNENLLTYSIKLLLNIGWR